MNVRIFIMVCLILLWGCAAPSMEVYAAPSGDAAPAPDKSKTGRQKENTDVYKQALEEMTPLTIGWTTDARNKAMEMDDGIVNPLDLATRVVQRTALPYREKMVSAWRKLPPDKERTAQEEVDRFEKRLIQRISDFIVQWRRQSGSEGGGAGNEEPSGGPSKE